MTLRGLAGGRVFADVEGRGAPLVVLLHGWGRDRHDLRRVAEGLPGTVACFDLPGFGSSPPPPVAWGSREYADLIAGAIGELRDGVEGPTVAPVLLLGHSFGGRVALCIAANEPWAAGLVLSGVPLLHSPPRKPPLRFRAMRALRGRGLLSEATMERARQRHGSDDYRTARGVMRETLVRVVAESYEDELTRLRCPTRFVWGEADTAAPPATARVAAALVHAPIEFIEVSGAGHDVHHRQPDVLRREIGRLSEIAA